MLNSVNQFLNENYSRRICLEELADACHFSKYYFAHKLKELSGMTFVAYLTAVRLDKAKGLLSNTSVSITEVSHRCGFGDLRSFNRAFRTAYHMTPSEFRKSIQRREENPSGA